MHYRSREDAGTLQTHSNKMEIQRAVPREIHGVDGQEINVCQGDGNL